MPHPDRPSLFHHGRTKLCGNCRTPGNACPQCWSNAGTLPGKAEKITWLKTMPQADLQQTFDHIWAEIRAAKLAGGQARNEASARSVSLAQQALELATEAGSDRFTVEAWRMLALTLSANEQYQEAIPYYHNAIEKFEEMGENALAAGMRIGYVIVLANTARYREAIEAA